MKKGFTLVELLVVISIIGVLAAALTISVPKALETARSMRCKTNLKNLAQAAVNYGVDHNRMPWAGSHEWHWPELSGGRYVTLYHERKGWVGWTGSGRWKNRDPQAPSMTPSSFFGDNAYWSITNGVLWSYVGKNLETYICDEHKKAARRDNLSKVLRSYVMNCYFGYHNKTPVADWREIRMDALSDRGNPGNLLLFAELPSRDIETSRDDADGVLETKIRGYTPNKSTEEMIGFNHRVAKRYVAHVAFADGHVDVLIEPKGASDRDIKDLTMQLCNGDEIEQKLREKMR